MYILKPVLRRRVLIWSHKHIFINNSVTQKNVSIFLGRVRHGVSVGHRGHRDEPHFPGRHPGRPSHHTHSGCCTSHVQVHRYIILAIILIAVVVLAMYRYIDTLS